MFQSFPLGDKSSVNLRGEFHTENVTTFDEILKTSQHDGMDLEADPSTERNEEMNGDSNAELDTLDHSNQIAKETNPAPVEKDQDKPGNEANTVDLDALYPIFWGLQGFFSAPTRLFDPQNFTTFRAGLEKTLSTFKLMTTVTDTWSTAKAPDELRRGLKRRRNGETVDVASSFNPKYLTSRELFDLEVSFAYCRISLAGENTLTQLSRSMTLLFDVMSLFKP